MKTRPRSPSSPASSFQRKLARHLWEAHGEGVKTTAPFSSSCPLKAGQSKLPGNLGAARPSLAVCRVRLGNVGLVLSPPPLAPDPPPSPHPAPSGTIPPVSDSGLIQASRRGAILPREAARSFVLSSLTGPDYLIFLPSLLQLCFSSLLGMSVRTGDVCFNGHLWSTLVPAAWGWSVAQILYGAGRGRERSTQQSEAHRRQLGTSPLGFFLK